MLVIYVAGSFSVNTLMYIIVDIIVLFFWLIISLGQIFECIIVLNGMNVFMAFDIYIAILFFKNVIPVCTTKRYTDVPVSP